MSLKASLKRVVQGTFCGLWCAGLGALRLDQRRRAGRDSPELWNSPGNQRVLVVAPHPDDEVAGCVGAILAHRQSGDPVRVSIATDGSRSRALGLTSEVMAMARRAEANAAATELDVELDWMGLPEGEWKISNLTDRLADVLSSFQPDVIYAPSRVDFHPEHERVARALAGALGESSTGILRVYAVQVPLTSILANLLVEIDPNAPQLVASLHAHRSQVGSLERCLRRRLYAGRRYRGAGSAETFWQLRPEHYRKLHRRRPDQPLHQIFRGLRYYAWSDPLAYLVGRDERRRLALSIS